MSLLTEETGEATRRVSLTEQPRIWLVLSGLLLLVLAVYLWGPDGVLRVPAAVYPQLAPAKCQHDALLLISAGILRQTAATASSQARDQRDRFFPATAGTSLTRWRREPAMEGRESAVSHTT